MKDRFKEKCAVVGIVGHPEASKYCYLGLYAMQHRGQEGAGIVSSDGEGVFAHRKMGLVADIFHSGNLAKLRGSTALGHNRYATFGGKDWQNLQPLTANTADGFFAIAHNGNLINANEVRERLEQAGAIFSTTSDTEVILHLIARERKEKNIRAKLISALKEIKGAYSLLILANDKLYALRDPSGVRPLSLGKIGEGYVLASETCAFDLIGATFIRDIEPGEIVEIDKNGSQTVSKMEQSSACAFCVFEYVYFARPDSNIDNRNVYAVRKELGAQLAREHPVAADIVIPVPDSGVPAALGFAQQMGLPMEFGLIRNHYVGRTFIEPEQSIRDFGVKVKLNANREILKGKKVIVVDDSIVRGTTCKKLIAMIREAGAREVHLRISSPPTIAPCHYGIDTPSKNELIAATHSEEEVCSYIAADSLGYLSIEGMYKAVRGERANYCDACFSGEYPLGVPGPAGSKPRICTPKVEQGWKKPYNRVFSQGISFSAACAGEN